jgi:hypothetical protein
VTPNTSFGSAAPARQARSRDATKRPGRPHSRREHGVRPKRRVLGRYTDQSGRRREVVARSGSAGSVLVVDRDVATLGDRRLVAHLAPDEPPENAALVCRCYLQDARRGRCRRVTPEDARAVPLAVEPELARPGESQCDASLRDGSGYEYRLELVPSGMSIPELRWRRSPAHAEDDAGESVSVREAIACLESYEPILALTGRALALHCARNDASITVLRVELARMLQSPIVLNRRLREVVLARIEREGLSMSEIAMRCGRVKRDCNGNESGETSWLARRLGILPEGGRSAPTPWVHSDVLALIARRGLGIAPREVELE